MRAYAAIVAGLVPTVCFADPPSNIRITPPMPFLYSPHRLDFSDPTHVNVVPAPPLSPGLNTVGCSVLNVSDHARQIRVELFRDGALGTFFQSTFNPFQHLSTPTIGALLLGDYKTTWCKFTVMDGKAGDIRGSIVLRKNDEVIAVLPAE
jgi:hypothetical protein